MKEVLRRLQKDPVFFARKILKIDPTPQQQELMMAIALNKHVAARSGHGIGKTTALASINWWFILTRPDCLVVNTAVKEDQLSTILWGEASRLRQKADPYWQDQMVIKATSLHRRTNQMGAKALARVARKETPEALQGFHHEHLLVVCDEASGIPDVIFAPLDGMMTQEDNHAVLTGNPTRAHGYFYDAFHSRRDFFKTFHFSSIDSPIVTDDYPKLVEKKYGKESNVYRVRVLGEFPQSDTNVLIPLELVEAAQERFIYPTRIDEFKIGVDPARSTDGDASGLVVRAGSFVIHCEEHWVPDEMQVAGLAMSLKIRMQEQFPEATFGGFYVDVCGLGAGVHDRLSEIGELSFGVNVATRPTLRRKISGLPLPDRLRDELWLKCFAFLKDGGSLPENEGLASELVGPRHGLTSAGNFKIEAKDSMKKRGLRSPNLADALCNTFFDNGAISWTGEL